MPTLSDEDDAGIRWGSPVKQASDEDMTFYSSFFSKEGVEYMLYDNVKVSNDSGDPYIGKIIKLWQDESIGVKKALIHWFFKSNELPTEPVADPREVFLAFGKGKGVTNENEVEVICGKCTIVCSSKDVRNRQPSESDIKNADFFFSQIYDVDLNQFRPIDEVVDKLGFHVVFNEEWITSVNASNGAPKAIEKSEHDAIAKHISHLKRSRNSEGSDEAHPNAKHHQNCFKKLTISSTPIEATANVNGIQKKNEMILLLSEPIKDGDTMPVITNVKNESNRAPKSLKKSKNNVIPKHVSRLKKVRDSEVSDEEQLYENKGVKLPSTPTETPTKSDGFKITEKVSILPEPSKDDNTVKVYKEMQNKEKKLTISTRFEIEKKSQTNDVTKTFEKRTILKDLTWEEKLEQNIKLEKVLLLENLDPLVTSADVREMLKSIFQGISDANVLPHEKDFPYGKALAIFANRSFADAALEEMEQKCLVMTFHRRTIIASKVEDPVNFSAFLGHLALDKLRLNKNHQSEDYKNAMSTSHCSQPNTIEYEMAMEWRQLEVIMQTCTNELFKKQRKEMEILMRGKKS